MGFARKGGDRERYEKMGLADTSPVVNQKQFNKIQSISQYDGSIGRRELGQSSGWKKAFNERRVTN